MPHKIVIIIITLISAFILLILGLIIAFILVISPSPDIPIGTPSLVTQIVTKEIPSEYKILSIDSIQRISEFEREHRPIKWLVLTLKDKTISDEDEMYKIAEPICKGLLRNNTRYEGLDINPHTTIRGGVDCSAWGP